MMIIELSVRYFLYNRKRTYKAIRLISLSLIIITSSSILISSLAFEVTNLTYLLEEGNDKLIITPTKNANFTDEELGQIHNYLDMNGYVINYLEQYISKGRLIKGINESYSIPYKIVEMNTLAAMIYPENDINFKDKILGSQDLMYMIKLNTRDYYQFQFQNVSVTNNIYDFIDNDLDFIHSGLYLDQSYFEIVKINMIEIKLTREADMLGQVKDLSRFDFLSVQHTRTEPEFLEKSAQQVQVILLILQVMISILVAIGIWNTFLQMVQESWYDIRIMLLVGYGKNDVRTLFFIISVIIGLISSVLAILVGLVLIYIIFSVFSIITSTSLIIPIITFEVIKIIIINGLLISIISSIHPIMKEVDL